MRYKLEKFDKDDVATLEERFSHDDELQRIINVYKKGKSTPIEMAVGDVGNTFLMLDPIVTRPETIGCDYVFVFHEKTYKLRSDGWFGNKITIFNCDEICEKSRNVFIDELRQAFKVLGQYGGSIGDSKFELDILFAGCVDGRKNNV